MRQGQRVTKEKAKEYLQIEMKQIAEDLDDLDLPIIDRNQQEALISFIHSIGWTPFLYSEIIDKIESGAEIRVQRNSCVGFLGQTTRSLEVC